jgi:hypothetical protein
MTSPRDAAHAAAKAGFGDAPYTNLAANQKLVTIVAIGIAESGGSATARNVNTNGSVDIGYWQINQVNWHGLSEAALKDINVNARVAKEVYDRQGFNAWTVYRTGKYRSHISTAQTAVKSLGTESVSTGFEDVAGAEIIGGAVNGVSEFLGSAWGVIEATSKWVGNPGNWVRIVQVVGGVALGLAAASIVGKPLAEDVKGIVK